jgi:AcrR family transcriptional regulator
MKRVAKPVGRRYQSELRDQQTAQTRDRILDAAVRVMARGVATLSVPDVAHEAGVSIPTVYRHFGTKQDLLAAVYPHVIRRAGFRDIVLPRTIDELRDSVRAIFERVDAVDDIARAAMASPASDEARALTVPTRVEVTRRLAESIEPKLKQADRDRIARLLTVLVTSSSLRVWRDQLGATVEQAADDIEWIVQAAISAARRPR